MMHRALIALTVSAFAITGSTACATKKYVNTKVGEVDGKVTTLSGDVEKNQQRINEVDQKAGAAGDAARAADAAPALPVRQPERPVPPPMPPAHAPMPLDKNGRRLVYEVVLNEAKGGFKFNKTDLPDDAKAALDKVITDLQADPKAVFFEIEGHTDNRGEPKYNEQLGMKRAEAVKRYLYETHQVPLHKINVISYGEDKPVSDNKTKEGRAENRRIVVRMLS